jgi:hypothetical protein
LEPVSPVREKQVEGGLVIPPIGWSFIIKDERARADGVGLWDGDEQAETGLTKRGATTAIGFHSCCANRRIFFVSAIVNNANNCDTVG